MKRVVLFIDIATRFGWAVGAPGETPTAGSKRAAPAGASPGEVFKGFGSWLNDFCKTTMPSAVFYEGFLDPRELGGQTNQQTMFMLIGLAAWCEGVCASRGIYNVQRANQSTIRRHFLGKGYDAKNPKPAVMRQCDILGWPYADDNAADALAGWSYATAQLAPQTAHAVTPLFAGNDVGQRRIAEAVARDNAARGGPSAARAAAEALFAGVGRRGPGAPVLARRDTIEDIPE